MRGRVWFYDRDAGRAAAEFERASGADWPNRYPALWQFLALSRIEVNGGTELAGRILRRANYKWPFPVARMFLGQISTAEARAAAANDDQHCEGPPYPKKGGAGVRDGL
jgi:lipoprotein NlpI